MAHRPETPESFESPELVSTPGLPADYFDRSRRAWRGPRDAPPPSETPEARVEPGPEPISEPGPITEPAQGPGTETAPPSGTGSAEAEQASKICPMPVGSTTVSGPVSSGPMQVPVHRPTAWVVIAGLALAAAAFLLGLLIARTEMTSQLKRHALMIEELRAQTSSAEEAHSQLVGLAQRLSNVEGQVGAMARQRPTAPIPTTQPDELFKTRQGVDELRTRLDAIERRNGGFDKTMGAIADRVGGFDKALGMIAERIDGVGKTVRAIGDRVGAVEKAVKDLRAPRPTLEQGIRLYDRMQFAPAREVFARLQETDPDDARVWYYAALANGYATNDWGGETERLVDRGVACERAGTPDAALIDATFAGLTPPDARAWLMSYRRRTVRH